MGLKGSHKVRKAPATKTPFIQKWMRRVLQLVRRLNFFMNFYRLFLLEQLLHPLFIRSKFQCNILFKLLIPLNFLQVSLLTQF